MYPTKTGSIDDATASDWNAASKPTTETKTFNQVERPAHYNQDDGIECIDAIKAQLTHDEFIGYIRGTIAKYNWRMMHKHPNPIQDASKIRWFSAYLEQYLLTSSEARS
mgnify:FL=1